MTKLIDNDGRLLVKYLVQLDKNLSYILEKIVSLKFKQTVTSGTLYQLKRKPVLKLEYYEFLLVEFLRCFNEFKLAYKGDYQFFLRWIVTDWSTRPYMIKTKFIFDMCRRGGRREDYDLEKFDNMYTKFKNLLELTAQRVKLRKKKKIAYALANLDKINMHKNILAKSDIKALYDEELFNILYDLAYDVLLKNWPENMLVYSKLTGRKW